MLLVIHRSVHLILAFAQFVFSGRLKKALEGVGAALTTVTNEEGWVGTVQARPAAILCACSPLV